MKEVVLFASAGRSDLQVLLRDQQGKYCRAEIARTHNRAFHEALLTRQVSYQISATGIGEEPDRAVYVDWNAERQEFKTEVLRDEGGRYILVPAKLVKVVNALRSRQDLHVAAVVLFNTHRTDPAIGNPYQEEPIAVGPVLARWLAEEFGLEAANSEGTTGLKRSGWINILDGSLQSPGTGRDAPIHREAVRRMDRCLRDASQWQEGLWACLSLGGGIPNAKDVLAAAAHYRFQGRTFLWQEPQAGQPTFIDPDKEPPTCQESLLAREHATQLLWNGDFAGAYGAVVHLKKNPEEKSWIRRLEKTNQYFAGTLTNKQDLPDYLSTLLNNRPRCLLVAMRAEAALWAGRIPEAISWTCTFAADAALLDFIEQRLQGMKELDDLKRKLTFYSTEQPPAILLNPPRDGEPCLVPQGNGVYKYSTQGKGKYSCWLQAIGSTALKNFRTALYNQVGKHRRAPIDLRNLNVHSLLPRELMQQAKDIFTTAGLWATDHQNVRGNYFMGQPLTQGVLRELGVAEPAAFYCNLLEGLQNDLANYEIR